MLDFEALKNYPIDAFSPPNIRYGIVKTYCLLKRIWRFNIVETIVFTHETSVIEKKGQTGTPSSFFIF